MADSIVGGLFGMTPEMYQQEQNQRALRQASELAQLDPFALAKTGIGYGANRLAGAIAGALGAEDPQLQQISQFQNLASQSDLTTPEGVANLGKQLLQRGDTGRGMALIQRSQQLAQEQAQTKQTVGLQQERERKALEETNVKRSRMQALMDSGAAKTMDEAAAIASNDQSFQVAMNLTKMTPEQQLDRDILLAAQKAHPNDPVAQKKFINEAVSGAKVRMLPATIQPKVDTLVSGVQSIEANVGDINRFTQALKDKEIKFGIGQNIWDTLSTVVGSSTESAKLKADLRATIEGMKNTILKENTGVQTDQDAIRAANELLTDFDKLDASVVERRLDNLNKKFNVALENRKRRTDQYYIENKMEPVYGTGGIRGGKSTPSSGTGASPASRRDELLKRATPEQRKQLGLN
jgi:hypothetical protein